jgi:hypothetical protein
MYRGGGASDNNGVNLKYYKRNPKAGSSQHSKIGWKSNLAIHDQLAVSDPNALAKSIKIEEFFKKQGAWTEKQKKDMSQRNDRYEHLVTIIKNELAAEHSREAKELEGLVESKKVGKRAQMDVWLERLDSIDKLMFVLKEYDIVGALDEADLLVYQVDKWSEIMKKQMGFVENKRDPSVAAAAAAKKENDAGGAGGFDVWDVVATAVKMENGTATRPGTEEPKKKKKKAKTSGGNAMMSAGASPYYESEVIFEKQKREQALLAKHWKRPPSRPLTSLSELKYAGDDDSMADSMADGDDDDMSIGSLDSSQMGNPGPSELGEGSVGTIGASVGSFGQPSLSESKSKSISSTSTSITKNGKVRIVPTGKPGGLPAGYKIDVDPEMYEAAVLGQKNRLDIRKNVKRQFKDAGAAASAETAETGSVGGGSSTATDLIRLNENEVIKQQHKAYENVNFMKERDAKKKAFKEGWKPPVFHRIERRPAHEIDNEKIIEAKQKFIAAGLGRNIRKGRKDDVAAYVPSLIPVPGAFEGDDTERLSSYVGANIVDGLQDRMCTDMGHTERRLLPLYVRNTLIEVNGTSANGDQTQEVLSRDRRYSHYHGRPLVRFEEGSELVDSRQFIKDQGNGFGPNKKEKLDKLAPLREEKLRLKTQKRIKDQRYAPMNRSMVRLVFGKEPKPAKDLAYVEHKL